MSEAMYGRAISPADALPAGDSIGAGEGVRPIDLGARPDDRRAAPARHGRIIDRAAATRALPRGDLSAFQRSFRHWFSRTISAVVMKTWFKVEVDHPERFLDRPCLYAFNHLSWMDTLLLLCTVPRQPRLYFYGPKQEEIRVGGKNRFMWWTGIPVPFSPLKDDLLTSVRRAQAVFDSGGSLAIAPEGSIHVHEGDLLPFEEGAAYLALRAQVPIVPLAITGTSWARFRGVVRVRVGEPIETGERPTRQAVARYTALTWHAIRSMVEADRDLPPPGRVGRWLTDVFNEWTGGREAAGSIHGPSPADVRIPAAEAR